MAHGWHGNDYGPGGVQLGYWVLFGLASWVVLIVAGAVLWVLL